MKKELSENEIKILMDGVEKNRAMALPLIRCQHKLMEKQKLKWKLFFAWFLQKSFNSLYILFLYMDT